MHLTPATLGAMPSAWPLAAIVDAVVQVADEWHATEQQSAASAMA